MPESRRPTASALLRTGARWAAVAIAFFVFVRVLASADLPRAAALIARIGPTVLVIVAPYLLIIGFDALAWRWLLLIVGRDLRFVHLLRVRLSTEAVLLSFPGGALLVEGLKPLLLARDGVPMAETTATLAAKKVLLIATQSLYLAAAALLGWNVLAAISSHVIGRGGLPFVVLGASLVLSLVSAAMLAIFLRGSLAARSHDLLSRVPNARLRRWLEARRAGFVAADDHLVTVFDAHVGTLARASVPFLLSWLAETLESWTILHLLGADLSFLQVMAFESVVSLLRSIVFFVPAGLGVQDAGYMTALTALSVRDAIDLGAAFVLLKRAKELFWIVTGYALLFARRGPRLAVDPVDGVRARESGD